MFAIVIAGSSNESIPVCSSNMPAAGYVDPSHCSSMEVMTFDCTVSFIGNPPSLSWSLANDSQPFNASVCQQQLNRINCSLTLRPDLLYDGSVFVCQTTATDGGRFNCSTDVIKVQRVTRDFACPSHGTNSSVKGSSDKETTTQGNVNSKEHGMVQTPQNQAVYLGQRMAFSCQPFNGSSVREWLYRPLVETPGATHNKLFTNWMAWRRAENSPEKYRVYGDESGFAELYLNETKMEDAGRYTCTFEINSKIVPHHAELIVFESEPECNVTEFSSRRIQVKCSVVYSGDWTPKMEWRHHTTGKSFYEGNLFKSVTDTVDYSNKTHVISTLTTPLFSASQQAFFVSCKIHFDPRDEYPSGMSTNVPEFIFIWNSTVFGEKNLGQTKSTGTESTAHPSHQPSIEAPNNENATLVYTVAALAFALILLMIGTLTYIVRKRKSRKLKEKSLANDEEAAKARAISGAYDTIEYDVIGGYEMLDQELTVDGLNRGYEVPDQEGAGVRVPCGYEDPDRNQSDLSSQYINTVADSDHKASPASEDDQMAMSSQYITTNADSSSGDSTAGISNNDAGDRAKQDNDYAHLYGFVGPKRNRADISAVGKQLPPYIQLIADAEEGRPESKANRSSVSSEGSEESDRMPAAASAGYTQLLPDAGFTPLVTE